MNRRQYIITNNFLVIGNDINNSLYSTEIADDDKLILYRVYVFTSNLVIGVLII